MERIKIIDTHCHPQFPQYDSDRDEIVARALGAGIGMIAVGTDLESSIAAVALAGRHEQVFASVGLHPNDNLHEPYKQDAYRALTENPKVVAIGEVGLDYYRTTDESLKEFQRKRFVQQIALAKEVSKPLIIHCRDAHEDMRRMLSHYGVVHSFTGTREDALAYVDLGYSIGVNGIITFTDQYNEAVGATPIESLLLETDAPYLSPVPYRGKRNEPSYIIETAKKLALIKGISVERIYEVTKNNAKKLFSIIE